MSRGGRNLLILGLVSIAITLVTSGVSLALYHESGDIYLDRSRPGFLPDEKEIEENTNLEYTFSDDGGKVSPEEIKEYLNELNEVQEKFKALPAPYSSESISNESLNITE